MKRLRDYVLMYDEACPICTASCCALVRAGVLNEDGGVSYQSLDSELRNSVDMSRAADEVALLDRKTGRVTYGAQSVMLILENSYPFLRPLFRLRWFHFIAAKAYRFIACNRRVILPGRDSSIYQPTFNATYRVLYLTFAWIVTATFLHRYSQLLVPLISPTSYGREFLICGGQILWQLPFVQLLHKGKTWDYLGNMMTISLGGGILLGLIQLIGGTFHNPLLFGGLFACVAGLMLLEHIRRTRILGVSSWLSVTWVLYRVVLLGVIL